MYLPLDYCKGICEEIDDEMEKCFETDLIYYFLYSPLITDKSYKGRFLPIQNIINNEDMIRDMPGSWIHSGMTKEERLTEWREGFTMVRNCYKWTRNKIIYQIDKDFETELLKTTGDCKIPYSMLKSLPYDCFYLEFQEDSEFSEFGGFFVNIVPYFEDYIIDIQRITHKEIVYSAMICIGKRARGFGTETYVDENGEKGFIFNGNLAECDHKGVSYYKESDEVNKRLVEHMKFVLQFIIYLCADNKDIKLSSESEQTYRKPTVIKNKYSEIRKYEVGFKIGKAVRVYKKKIADYEKSEAKKQRQQGVHASGYTMKPHMRAAHWHTYWAGKGRTEKRLNWLSDIFVHQEYAEE